MSDSIRAILLDAGNTLVYVDPGRAREVFRALGVETAVDAFRAAEREARAELGRAVEESRAAEGLSGGTERHVWHRYFTTLFRGCGVPEARAEEVGNRLRDVHETDHLWTHVEEETEETLERLLDMGFRLAVVSNADGRVERLLEHVGLRPFFEFVLDSHVVGIEKPDPEIFLRACRRLELAPAECLYVGDLYPVDVLGARAAGLRAVLLDPFGDHQHRTDVDCIPSIRHLPAYLGGGPREPAPAR